MPEILQQPSPGPTPVTLHYVISVLSRAVLPSDSCLWGCQNGTLLGNRVFADAISKPEVTLGSGGHRSSGRGPRKKRRRRTDPDPEGGQPHEMEAEAGGTWPPAGEQQGQGRPEEKDSSLGPSEGSCPASTLILDFWPPEPGERAHFWGFQPPSLWWPQEANTVRSRSFWRTRGIA